MRRHNRQNRNRPNKAWGLFAVLALVLAACGDDGGSGGAPALDGREQEFADAIAAAMRDEATSEEQELFSAQDMSCVADSIVAVLGVEGLVALGLDLDAIEAGDDLDDVTLEAAQADEIVDGTFDCLDFSALIAADLGAEAVSDESLACLGDALEESEMVRSMMAASLLGQETAEFEDLGVAGQAEIFEMVTDCLSAEELVQLSAQD